MTTEPTYTVGRIIHAPDCATPDPRPWPKDYAKLVTAHLAIARLRAALQRCIAPDGEAARLKHEALLES